MLEAGKKAPSTIKIIGEDGKPITLAALVGQYVVLYFYPKDDTPGCTTEACEFRDFNADIQKLGVAVIGVSKDTQAAHTKFKKKFKLNFPLWSDPRHELMDAFGVWTKKKFMGRTFMGTVRTTFVIDPKGKIIKVWEEVKPSGHAKVVYDFLKQQLA
jgi:peroxiredoxin Q/BCP